MAPPQFGVEALEDSYLAREGDADVVVELRARLIPPHDSGTSQPGYFDLLFTTDPSEDENTLLINTLDMPTGLQAQGFGRLVMGQLAVLGDQLGLEAIELDAGKVGRWAWMRCGFDFVEGGRGKVLQAAEAFAGEVRRPERR